MPHVVERLVEIGLTEAAGMAAGPLSWGAINEWQRGACITLMPWETRLIRRLSLAYVTQMRAAEEETCAAPWRGEITQADRNAEFALLTSILG